MKCGNQRESCRGWEEYCKKENSLVRELFHGQLKSTLKCCKCSFKSESYEPFCFLNLPIPLNEAIRTVYKTIDGSSTSATSTKFDILCFNDKIFNEESSYLIMNLTFKNVNEFKLAFRGAGVWIVVLNLEEKRVSEVRTKLPSVVEISDKRRVFIAFKAEIMYKNHLVTFVAAKSGEVVGFPILVRTELNESLTPALFIKNFLKSTIRPIYVHRFPERLKSFDLTVSLMESSAIEYFEVEYLKTDHPDLYHVRVVILNDKSDFNEMIFFKEIGDPMDLFEELCIDLSDKIDAETEDDDQGVQLEQVDRNYLQNSQTYTYTYNYSQAQHQATVSLKDCFDKLFSSEKFDEWKCEKCEIPVEAEKKLELWRLPEILILHLKRFSYGGGYGGGAKITKAVDFPLRLELEAKGTVIYELFGISQHFGSLNFGHYTAILKHQPTGKWFLADDSTITVYEQESEWFNEKLKESAYVLFYRIIN